MYIKPTDAELEILNFLWNQGPSTVRTVHEHISTYKTIGYTTTLKLMQIMHDKGVLYRTEQGKSHIYVALLGKEETQQNLLKRLSETAFESSPLALIIQALNTATLTYEEIRLLRTKLNLMEAQTEH
jgi:BlaI family penicillinase repressor